MTPEDATPEHSADAPAKSPDGSPAAALRAPGGRFTRPPPSPDGATPVMRQYLEMKAERPSCLLFFRMGDFYELFFEDAELAAEALNIALTKRGTHQDAPIPMCGVPIHHAERYLHRLIRAGFRVAVAEQLEDPAEAKKRGSKAVVKRDVIRVVTPGTVTEDALLDGARHNYIAALDFSAGGDGAAAWADISTGDVFAAPLARADAPVWLAATRPAEALLRQDGDPALRTAAEQEGIAATDAAPAAFARRGAERRAAEAFGAATLEAFGAFSPAECAALAALADYLVLTQCGQAPVLKPPKRVEAGGALLMDAATRRNLELTRSLSGGRAGTLVSVLDHTVTAAGARLLERRVAEPLTDVAAIAARHDQVAVLAGEPDLRAAVRGALRGAPDLERALGRLGVGRGGPRDLGAVARGLAAAAAGRAALSGGAAGLDASAGAVPPAFAALARALGAAETLGARLGAVLAEELPLRAGAGDAIAPGADAALDEALALRDRSRQVIAELQARYQEETGVGALKIRHNNILGYFVEVPAAHDPRMTTGPAAEIFRRRQTMANAVRFTSDDLEALETRIAEAGAAAAERERALLAALTEACLAEARALAETAEAVAALDVAAALAEAADLGDWTRPVITEDRRFRIVGGRHPVVAAALRAEGAAPFVANDCDLSGGAADAAPIWLITGPNMAGKSTFLRQNALIAILAQMGAFVPADRAEIGLVRQLFSRVGASDDLARGRSTFMVEMVETAAILNQAGPDALVILDEIGRGTATYDGLAIAWASLEHLARAIGCRALFATHYHELTALGAEEPGVRNVTVAVREWRGEVVFLREIVGGAADRSYGVQVAQLAGLPETVVARARDVLAALERGEESAGARAARLAAELPLFAAAAPPPAALAPQSESEPAAPPAAAALQERLAALDPDAMTPRDALDALYDLKALADTP